MATHLYFPPGKADSQKKMAKETDHASKYMILLKMMAKETNHTSKYIV